MLVALTQKDIEIGLQQIGVKRGMILEVHCSLSKFGHVAGGAETIISALKSIIGTNGAILMPSFRLSKSFPLTDQDKKLGLTYKAKVLEDDELSAMGIVADTFCKMSDVLTGSGIFGVSAWGKDAEIHSQKGFQYLIDLSGYALLLGVDIYRLSSMHYVEDMLPIEIKNKFVPTKEARFIYPEDQWFIEAWEPTIKPWYVIQDRAYQKGFIADGMIGNCKCMLLKVKDVIELYRLALLNEPFELYGLT